MQEQAKQIGRNDWLDCLKGIAIISVVLYHFKILSYGYLGVDVFLVINGYLITKGILDRYNHGEKINYIQFVVKRIMRLWPLVLFVGIASLVLGAFLMLPDDLENLAESVVASNFFANNILAEMTTKNYWDVIQDYKPLMHTWYLGILAPFYVMYPLVFIFAKRMSTRFRKDYETVVAIVLAILCGMSLFMYCMTTNAAARFYGFPYRFYELLIGGLMALSVTTHCFSNVKKKVYFVLPVLCILLVDENVLIPAKLDRVRLIIVVLLTAITLVYSSGVGAKAITGIYQAIVTMGKSSYSIFIWHQPVIAFWRYAINANPSVIEKCGCLLITGVLSIISYCGFEKKRTRTKPLQRMGILCAICVLSTAVCLFVYSSAGVLRDVPELDISSDDVHRGMHAEYNERIRKMNTNFTEDGRSKVLVCGNSFGRDWVNILLEADMNQELDIVYIPSSDLSETDIVRIQQADYIFVNADTKVFDTIPTYLIDNMRGNAQLYGIGTKCYGDNNGNIYSHRYAKDYYKMTASYETVADLYGKEKILWGRYYIDFIKPVLYADDTVSVFTDDKKYISQDCRHLTQAGARYYAKLFDFQKIFTWSSIPL